MILYGQVKCTLHWYSVKSYQVRF